MNVDLEGFNIPRGTAVYANVWNVMHGEDYWKNPELFDPTRFLDETGTKLRRREHYIPFMLGRRFCIGQTLAEKQLFLFFVSLLQKFQFQAPEGPDKVTISVILLTVSLFFVSA
jgi:cytochrome P450